MFSEIITKKAMLETYSEALEAYSLHKLNSLIKAYITNIFVFT